MVITGARKRKYLNFFNRTLDGSRKLSQVKMISMVDAKDRPSVVVLFEWLNSSGTMQMSIASKNGWKCTRNFLYECFNYTFNTCGARLCTVIVNDSMTNVLEFGLRIGMRKEFDRPVANYFGDNGGWILCMKKDECKWIRGHSNE